MRVITGTAKGRKLFSFTDIKTAPSDGRRPTSDYLKEAIFSMIQFDIEGRRVLDLFSGTGQLGIEALSRGAACADFVDVDVTVVKKNLGLVKMTDISRVFRTDAIAFLKSAETMYDLVFLDPPYKSALADKTLAQISAIDILHIGGIIVCESQKEQADMDGYSKSCRKYSDKVITLYRRCEVNG